MIESIVLEEVTGFFKSRVILSAAELDLFTMLDRQQASADALADELKCDERALTRLLDCLVALKFLFKEDGIYRPTPIQFGVLFEDRRALTVIMTITITNQATSTIKSL